MQPISGYWSGVFAYPTRKAKSEIDECAQLSGHPFVKITVEC